MKNKGFFLISNTLERHIDIRMTTYSNPPHRFRRLQHDPSFAFFLFTNFRNDVKLFEKRFYTDIWHADGFKLQQKNWRGG